MPARLKGKKLTRKEHRIWKSTYQGAQQSGAREPGAVATAQVLKGRKKAKRRRKR